MKEMALEEAQLMEEHKARSDEARLREILQKQNRASRGVRIWGMALGGIAKVSVGWKSQKGPIKRGGNPLFQ